jgi:hypothetical protein
LCAAPRRAYGLILDKEGLKVELLFFLGDKIKVL